MLKTSALHQTLRAKNMPWQSVCSDEKQTLETSATHQLFLAKTYDINLCWLKQVYSLLAKEIKQVIFSKLVFEYLLLFLISLRID